MPAEKLWLPAEKVGLPAENLDLQAENFGLLKHPKNFPGSSALGPPPNTPDANYVQ